MRRQRASIVASASEHALEAGSIDRASAREGRTGRRAQRARAAIGAERAVREAQQAGQQ